MITWMPYAVVAGLLFVLAAAAAERVARILGRPSRFVWAGALGAALAWPLLAPRLNVQPPAPERAAPAYLPAVLASEATARAAGMSDRLPRGLPLVLGWVWATTSVVLLARIALGLGKLARRRRRWVERQVDGIPVLVSPEEGPAVVGVIRPSIVLPEWLLALEPQHRALVLRHEEEHRRAGDPLLLLGAAVAVALVPWNPAVWVAARRLRLAMEVDCDARVLRGTERHERYGLLLLTIAQRRAHHPALAAALVERPSHLERRITAMNMPRIRHPRATALALAGAATLAIIVACTTYPTSPAPQAPDAAATRAAQTQTYFEFQVEKQVGVVPGTRGPRYPEMLRNAGVEGEVLVQFVVDQAGVPDMSTFRVLRSTHELFTIAVRNQIPEMAFRPAEIGGRTVRQHVQMPFVFTLSR